MSESYWKSKDPSPASIVASKLPSCDSCDLKCKSIRIKPQIRSGGDILILADSPTQHEHTESEGFSDPVYRLIKKMLVTLGITERVTLDYTVKCWNWEPMEVAGNVWKKTLPASTQAIRTCRPQFMALIKELKPKVIICIGSRALQVMTTRSTKLSKHKGLLVDQFMQWGDGDTHNYKLMATDHPRTVYTSGNDINYSIIQNNIVKALDYLDGTDSAPKVCKYKFIVPTWLSEEDLKLAVTPPWARGDKDPTWDIYKERIASTPEFISFEDVMELLRKSDTVYADIETNSLNPYGENSEVATLGFGFDRNIAYVLPVIHHDFDYKFDLDPSLKVQAYTDLYEIMCEVAKKTNVWHGASFDVRYLDYVVENRSGMKIPFWDAYKRGATPGVSCTLQKHFLCYPLSPHKMDEIVTQLGYHSHKKLYDHYKNVHHKGPKKDYSTHAMWILGPYNAWDCGVTAHFDDFLSLEMSLRPHLQRIWYDRYRGFIHSYLRISSNGLNINVEASTKARLYLKDKLESAEREVYFNPIMMDWLVSKRGFSRMRDHNSLELKNLRADFNIGSDVQVSTLLFGYSGAGKVDTPAAVNDPSYGLGFDRSLSSKNSKGFGVSGDVLEKFLVDYTELKLCSPYSGVIGADVEGNPIRDISSSKLLSTYLKSVGRGAPKDRVLSKLSKYTRPHLVSKILERRSHKKNISTYVPTENRDSDSVIDKSISNNRLRPSFKVHGTVTGRASSYFHTIPNDKMIKNQFESTFGEEGLIVGSDQGQIEARIAGTLSLDPGLCKIFREGGDIHTIVSSEYYRRPAETITKEERQIVKAIHFGVIYRRGVESLSNDLMKLGLSKKDAVEFATSFIESYWQKYHYLYEWRERMYNDVKKDGWAVASNLDLKNGLYKGYRRRSMNYTILTPFGRETHYAPGEYKNSLKRLTCSYPIQSTAGDITTSAAARIERKFFTLNMRSRVVHVIHDAVYADVHISELEQAKKIIKEEMLRTDLYESWLVVPFATDLEIGRSWGSLKSEGATA